MTFVKGHKTSRVALGDDLRGYVRYKRTAEELPYKRIGMCCGAKCREKMAEVPVYRVYEGMCRYRCRRCFRKERGHYP